MTRRPINRRAFLRGTGSAVISLPFLEAMLPNSATAQAAAAPIRSCFCLYPYGSVGDALKAGGAGSNYTLPGPYAAHLGPHRATITYINDVVNHWGKSNGDGAGDHARGQGSYLTQAHLLKDGLNAGKSCDQFIRDVVKTQTAVDHLNIKGPGATGGDSGYSSEYKKVSWINSTTPDTPIDQPHLAFDKLFKNFDPTTASEPVDPSQAIERRLKRSILDDAIDDANQLHRRVGREDRVKLDQYLTSVREVEQRIALAIQNEEANPPPSPAICVPGQRPDTGLSFDAKIKIMFELIRLGFQCDVTRLATFFMASPSSFGFIGVSGAHHSISHHGDDSNYPVRLLKINEYYAQRWAEFINAMKNTPDVGGTNLLQNSIVTFGTDLRDGNRHDNDGMSVAVAGSAGGAYTPGKVVNGVTRISNIWLTIMRTMGVKIDSFGEGEAQSTGVVAL